MRLTCSDAALRADEEHAPAFEVVLGARHFAVGEGHEELVVLPGDREGVGHLFGIGVGHREERAGRRRLDRHLLVGVHEPVGHVDVVRAPVGHQPAAVVVPGAESETARLERLLRRGPLPHVPVEPRRHRLLGFLRPRVRARLDDVDVRDVAEDAAVEDLLRFHEVIPAALLRADLDDLLALPVGVEHRVQPRHRVRGRLLDVDVLAGGDGVDRLLACQ